MEFQKQIVLNPTKETADNTAPREVFPPRNESPNHTSFDLAQPLRNPPPVKRHCAPKVSL